MRTISIDTDVFARIWAHRFEGEETENDILRRLLSPSKRRQSRVEGASEREESDVSRVVLTNDAPPGSGKIRWRDDVCRGLVELGGKAHLSELYAKVRSIRRQAGRTLPPTTDDIIRRELENNSAQSDAYLGKRDWFNPVDGKGAGVWALKSGACGIS